ncbi:MAG: autotransporter domain-containing protein [Parvibaculaceae bacterium]|nr:autotransporter domain-containing protein [Parvibaculaceae bacterium]HBM88923.1 autotransporter domain-containing protein [Rhodobiaceae bacterium]
MGKGQIGLKAVIGLAVGISGFGAFGIQPAAAATSAGCAAANAGTFDLSIPVGNNLQFGGSVSQTFAAGDVITATTTGAPTGTQAFLSPGSLSIVNASFADVMGSATIPSAGTFTLTRTLSANPANGGTLTFTCAPGPMVVAPVTPTTPPPTTPTTNDQEEADTATNATTTAVIVEDRVVGGILDDIITTNPEPEGPDQAELEERRKLIAEWVDLREERERLEREAEELAENKQALEEALERDKANLEKESDPDTRDPIAESTQGSGWLTLLSPINIEEGTIYNLQRAIEREEKDLKAISAQIEANRARLTEVEARQDAINGRVDNLPRDPGNPNDRYDPSLDLEDLGSGDGESILFVGRDPFARAVMRYRGFRLDVADTGDGFSDTVKPLSFTRTLSSTIVGWVRAVYTDYEQDDASQQEGDNILVALGAHKDFSETLRLGLMATTTWGDVSSPVNNLDIDTTGYSLGAYGRYKWGEIDVNASTRIGLTDNDITVGGTTGSYDTRLASATFGISGQEQLTDDVWMRPAVSVTGTWVNREDYQNSAGTNIGGNTTWSGNVSAGPTFGTSLTPPSGFKRLEPAIGLQATYTFSDQDSQAGTVATSEDDYLSLSLSPQLSMELDNGASLDVFGSYFGIGADLDGWSVGGTLSIPLN